MSIEIFGQAQLTELDRLHSLEFRNKPFSNRELAFLFAKDIARYAYSHLNPFVEANNAAEGSYARIMVNQPQYTVDDPNQCIDQARELLDKNEASLIVSIAPHRDVWDSPIVTAQFIPLLTPQGFTWISAAKFTKAFPGQDFGVFSSASEEFAKLMGFGQIPALHQKYITEMKNRAQWFDDLTLEQRTEFIIAGSILAQRHKLSELDDDELINLIRLSLIDQAELLNKRALAMGQMYLEEPGHVLGVFMGGTRRIEPLERSMRGVEYFAVNEFQDNNGCKRQKNTMILMIGMDGTQGMYPFEEKNMLNIVTESDLNKKVTFYVRGLVSLAAATNEAGNFQWITRGRKPFNATDWLTAMTIKDWMDSEHAGYYAPESYKDTREFSIGT